METTSPSEKRKSFLIATCIYALLLLLLFFIRFWPPSDAELASLAGGGGGGGVEVNFGDTEFGSGDNFKSEVLDVKDSSKQTQAIITPEEDIISEDDDADKTDVVIPKNDKPKVTKPVVIKETKPVVVKPKVNNSATSALDNILKGNKGGDGNSSTSGNQGSSNGSINSNGYGNGGSGGGTGGGNGTGNGTGTGAGSGSGSGGGNGSGNGLGKGPGYYLNGRKPLSKPPPDYNCGNEYGLVFVRIFIDKNGNPINAIPGVKGTTNTDSCLLSEAKKAAMKTKWEPSPNGAEKQEGVIGYSFSIQN